MNETEDRRQAKALLRFQMISAYLAEDPPRGRRTAFLERLAAKSWPGVDGEPFQAAGETLRKWVRSYRRWGLEGLKDKVRPVRGSQVLNDEQLEFACRLKREVPERTLDRLIEIMEVARKADPGQVRRSTLHRHLQAAGLSGRGKRVPDKHDLGRFEADYPNALWQSDMMVGPWLPDPNRPGKMRRAYLYAFLDDHSRLLLHGRFSFKGDLPALELVFRRSIQKYGLVRRVYYDNGMVYRSHHMKQIIAELGIHRIIHTRPYRPMGHGKIEALNKRIRGAFLSELKASRIDTLDALNEAFLAWADLEYNRRVHSQTGQTPLERWRAGIDKVRFADDEKLRQAFLWSERRRVDKTAIIQLFGTQYQVDAALAKRTAEVRYDPEALEQIEVWHKGRFVQRAKPLVVQAWRRPKKSDAQAQATDKTRSDEPVADWLGHLVDKRQEEGFVEPSPRELAEQVAEKRRRADDAVVELLRDRLDEAVFDDTEIRAFLDQYGPFDIAAAKAALGRILQGRDSRADHHVTVYLEAIRKNQNGEHR